MAQEPYTPEQYPAHQPPPSNYYSPQDPYASGQQGMNPYNQQQQLPPQGFQKRHSGLGIASLSLSVFAGVGLFGCVIVAGVLEATTPGGIDETSAAAIVVGLIMFAFLVLALLGGGLGIGALFQSATNKLFAILGIVGAALTFFFFVALMVLGSLA